MKFIPVAADRFEFLYIETAGLFDRESGVQRTDKENVPQWEVRCLVRQIGAEQRPELLPIKVASRRDLGEVLTPFSVVEFSDLMAYAWVIHEGRGNDGVAFSASGVSMVKASKNGAAKSEPVAASAS